MAKKGYCVAGSMAHALNTMSIDWRWEKVGQTTFKDPNGDTIEAVSDCTRLRGLSADTPVYFGYEANKARGFDDWIEWWDAQQQIADDPEDA